MHGSTLIQILVGLQVYTYTISITIVYVSISCFHLQFCYTRRLIRTVTPPRCETAWDINRRVVEDQIAEEILDRPVREVGSSGPSRGVDIKVIAPDRNPTTEPKWCCMVLYCPGKLPSRG